MTLPKTEDRLALILSAQHNNRDAMQTLLVSLYPLMCRIGNGFMKQSPGFSVDDLIQEGMLACVDAIRWFKPVKGYQLTTYAADCARRRMWRFLKQEHNRPLPTFGEDEDFEQASVEERTAVFEESAAAIVAPSNPLEKSIFACMNRE